MPLEDGESYLVVVELYKQTGARVLVEYEIIHAAGDSETPIELYAVDECPWGWEYDAISWWMPLDDLPPLPKTKTDN